MKLAAEWLRARLGETTLFRGIPAPRLEALAHAASPRRFAAGHVIWERESRPDAMLVVLRGRLDVVRTARGHRRVLRTLYPPDAVGVSCVAGAPHSATIVAGPGLEAAILPGAAVRALIRREPDVALRAISALGDLIARLSTEKDEIAQDDLETRVRRWVEGRAARGPEILCTHEEIAEHLGATRPRVSQALKRLERAGMLLCLRGRVRWTLPARPSGVSPARSDDLRDRV